MNREDFRENSVERIIFDFWDNPNQNQSSLEFKLLRLNKQELVDFIVSAQSRGRFGDGYIHP